MYVMFSIDGDQEKEKIIMYNGSLGDITREYSTLEDTKTPVTESIPTTFIGDNATGITVDTYKPTDAGYDTLFTNPPVPGLASQSE